MKKKFFFIIIFVGLSICIKAQLSLSMGGKTLFTSYKTMNNFRTSYNNYLENKIDKKLKAFSIGEGYEIGCTYQLGVMFFNIVTYNQNFYSRTVQYNSGAKRQFNLKFNYYTSGLGFGYANEEDYSIYFFGNIASGATILRTYYIYPGGSKDIGPSHHLNGVYSSIISMKPTTGLRFSFPIHEYFSVYGNLEYVFAYNIQFDDGSLKFYMQDINDEKIMKNQMQQLPDDYAKFNELGGTWSAYYGDDENGYVEGDISGLMITLGIKYNIPGSGIND